MSRPRGKIDPELKERARKLFESGVDMIEIHQRTKINLRSLYNLSSKEKWRRGFRKELLDYIEAETEVGNIVVIRESKKKESIDRLDLIKDKFNEIFDLNDLEEIKIRADSLEKLMKINRLIDLSDKEKFNIRSEPEEIEFQIKKITYETLKSRLLGEEKQTEVDLELKKIELQNKKIELKFKKTEAEAYGVEINE